MRDVIFGQWMIALGFIVPILVIARDLTKILKEDHESATP